MNIGQLHAAREPDNSLEANRARIIADARGAHGHLGKDDVECLILRVMCLERHTRERNDALGAAAAQAQTIAAQERAIARLSA